MTTTAHQPPVPSGLPWVAHAGQLHAYPRTTRPHPITVTTFCGLALLITEPQPDTPFPRCEECQHLAHVIAGWQATHAAHTTTTHAERTTPQPTPHAYGDRPPCRRGYDL
ncbi:hypothetical protein LX15_002827 [Streptoalloteichus tenebrarius]|uniref:Uncharacterized protein n=1 Tax=Streptoalloteichus tenebrarius (strain ATCC 17920 / DSM 40477 / JCM 4838 / CBS 697.72 / NBRC 16177 / NCIMB 11028 / NRRL B-12390 / A12253. 1 / ISP 5477) TaxID=1933 RepID=A0ABT1HUD1_STRSD|nr:hypothetical protein [Streptoalloteichus tenebrarius]MCP2259126.1 hypothetical protein [Streptoalloteichus tenebrarius]BFF04399.1 hypothetical protein GCM10020241_60740 [Streptoalloteichus tenebrarius]